MRSALRIDRHDDRLLAVLLFVVGGIRVAIALVRGEAWGAEPTIALAMVVLGFALARSR